MILCGKALGPVPGLSQALYNVQAAAIVRAAPGSGPLHVLLPRYCLRDLFFFPNHPRHRYPNRSSTSLLICELGKSLSLGSHSSIYKVVVIIIMLQKVKIKRYFIHPYYMHEYNAQCVLNTLQIL